MPLFDLDRPTLESYLPDVCEPADFDAFWADTLAEARTFDLGLLVTKVDVAKSVEVYEFNEHEGGGGHQFVQPLPWQAAIANGLAAAGVTGSGAR